MDQLPCWLYKQIGNDVKGLIVENQDDYDLMINQGYKDNPRNCKEEPKVEAPKIETPKVEEPKVEAPAPIIETTSEPMPEPEDDEWELGTKEQLVEMAKEKWDVELNINKTKVVLINEIKDLKAG